MTNREILDRKSILKSKVSYIIGHIDREYCDPDNYEICGNSDQDSIDCLVWLTAEILKLLKSARLPDSEIDSTGIYLDFVTEHCKSNEIPFAVKENLLKSIYMILNKVDN